MKKKRVVSFFKLEPIKPPKEIFRINIDELNRVIRNSEELEVRENGCPVCQYGGGIVFSVNNPHLLEQYPNVVNYAKFCPSCGKKIVYIK